MLIILQQSIYCQVTVDQLVGVNTRASDQIGERLKNFELVREYHFWSIDQGFGVDSEGRIILPNYLLKK